MDQLKEHPQIVELLDTLDKNGLMKEKNEVQSLVSYIGGMEETLTEMLGELQDMRREINLIHNNTLRSKCHTLVEKTEGKIRQGFSAVKKMKDNLIQSAGNAVRAFRERGRDALAESVRAMKIPEALDKLSAMFGRMSKEMAQDTKKLSAMQTELQGAKGHLKNMGLLFMGKAAKEAEHSKTDKGVLSRLSRLFEKAQKGFASLEQKAMDTADKLRVSRVKSSVKENLSRYRAAAKAEKGTERSEPTASKEENRTAQALGQISVPHPQKSNLSKERYPDVISRYTPFILLSMAQGEVISESHRNNDKYEKRSKRTIDVYGYEDDIFEQFHPKSIAPFIDPFDKAEEEQIEEEKEKLRQLELSKVRQALSMLQPVQRERLLKSVLLGISSRKIAKIR